MNEETDFLTVRRLPLRCCRWRSPLYAIDDLFEYRTIDDTVCHMNHDFRLIRYLEEDVQVG
jgi:hypothetical protein